MEETFVDWVYDTLTDLLAEEYLLPEVENLFDEGKPCAVLYENVQEAYRRICEKYNVEYDDDVESIISDMDEMCREIGYKMYKYGAKYGAGRVDSAKE